MSDDKSQSSEINIPGDGHTFIGSANEVNISGSANVYLAGEVAKSEVVPFGKITISLEDSKLLEELKKDYDELVIKCIKTDFTVPGVDINLYDEIDIRYREKWDVKMLKFKNKELRRIIFDMIGALNDLTQYLTDEYMRALETPRGYVLIARNESWEQGCNLREILRPQTTKLRYKLRDLYREIHPEKYKGMPSFDDYPEED